MQSKARGPKVARYGCWQSPISSALITKDALRLSQPALQGGILYWVEGRTTDNGRNVVVRRDKNDHLVDLTPAGFNARTRVHEYGGGAYTVCGESLCFINDQDQQIYQQNETSAPLLITHLQNGRFADGVYDPHRNRLVCILEDHSPGAGHVVNSLVSVALDGAQTVQVLMSADDFYSSPALSPDGTKLAWLSWNQPDMPWDATRLWLAGIDDGGQLRDVRKLAGGPKESIFQPQWTPDGKLLYVSDARGWWNICRADENSAECLLERDAEFGLPQWVFGMSTYAVAARNRVVVSFFEDGKSKLGLLDPDKPQLHVFDLPFTHIDGVCADGDQAAFIAGSPVSTNAVVLLDLTSGSFEIVRRSSEASFDTTYFSRPEAIEFPTENGMTAHAYYYAPQNPDCTAPGEELPPLIVKSHGGPTGATSTALDLRIQFWTSRGFAVLDVNYGGSTGYGRAYRQRLDGKWGITDVDDCVNAARFLVEADRVDGRRLIISGGSAGGYTTLSALTFRDYFKAGCSYYGISELTSFATDTHKFEARYLDRLVGRYPEERDTYLARSPIYHTDKLSCPIILMQGLEDKIVPPEQSEKMVAALRDKQLPFAYLTFPGEQHGFRKAETIRRSLEAELYFYSRIFGFSPADQVEPIDIENL